MTYEEMTKNPEQLALFRKIVRDINKDGKATETTMEQIEILLGYDNDEED